MAITYIWHHRDLFRWAERHPTNYEELAAEGYMLLAERLRNEKDKLFITVLKIIQQITAFLMTNIFQEILKKHMKVTVTVSSLYSCENSEEFKKLQQILASKKPEGHDDALLGLEKIVWTKSMKRLFTLIGKCLKHKEPVLLVGETGSSKTTICQLYAALLKQKLHILNCHQHTETADFLGGLRPVRGKDQIVTQLVNLVKNFLKKIQLPSANKVCIHLSEG
jgi:midasin